MIILFALAVVSGALNQNVTQTTIGQTVCVKGWTATVRPPQAYTEGLKYKLLRSRHGKVGDYELDHAIPLSLGGSPADPRNLWLQRHWGKWNAARKDRLEVKLHTLVCKGTITLGEAQKEIWPRWIASYKRRFGP
jgi:hypothetical protein